MACCRRWRLPPDRWGPLLLSVGSRGEQTCLYMYAYSRVDYLPGEEVKPML